MRFIGFTSDAHFEDDKSNHVDYNATRPKNLTISGTLDLTPAGRRWFNRLRATASGLSEDEIRRLEGVNADAH